MKVYCIENKIDNKKYVGITRGDINRRFKQHKTISNTKNTSNKSHLHNAMSFHGVENFFITEIDSAEHKDELFEKEKYWINKLDTKRNGYNETDGGEGTFGWKATDEQRKHNSERIKKVMQDENLRKLLSEKTKQHWNSLSEDEKKTKRNQFLEARKSSTGSKGKTWNLSDETKRKMSESKKGYKMSDETKQKLSDIAKTRTGRKCSPETLEKMRQSAILRHQRRKVGT